MDGRPEPGERGRPARFGGSSGRYTGPRLRGLPQDRTSHPGGSIARVSGVRFRRAVRAWLTAASGAVVALAIPACGPPAAAPVTTSPRPTTAGGSGTAYDPALGTATLRGRVFVRDAPPPPAPDSSTEHGPPPGWRDERFERASDGGVPHAFVRAIEGPSLGLRGYPAEDVVVDQVRMRFVPHVAGVVFGRSVRFTNSDACVHNVHVSHAALDRWNPTQTPGASSVWRPERAATGVRVLCDLHSWMRLWIHVVEHPFFAVTASDGAPGTRTGEFEVRGLYPGRHRFRVWHETWAPEPGVSFEIGLVPGQNDRDVTLSAK